MIKGLIEKTIKAKVRGYQIKKYECECGAHKSIRLGESTKCKCGKKMKHVDTIPAYRVSKILSNKIIFICPTCQREFDKPEYCCSKMSMVEVKHVYTKQIAYMCPECGGVFKKQVDCCGVPLVEGTIYPHVSEEEETKLKDKVQVVRL